MAREINLVPDIKNDMIKALKLRNFIFFLSIVIASGSIGVTLFTGLIMAGQQAALSGKEQTINTLSDKMNSYNDLKEFLTIRDQLGDIQSLTGNKRLLSRTFNILAAIIPTGADSIKISELNVDLSGETPSFNFEAQANAGQEPFIDYNVLDAFKKSMSYMEYDYGDYVDSEGRTIPAYCMIESDLDGSVFNDPVRGYYAFWTKNAEGCNPALESNSESDSSNSSSSSAASSDDSSNATEEYNGQKVVRIWRTPQFDQWYKSKPSDKGPSMTLDGQISNVEHFESSCISYYGESVDDTSVKWTSVNESCKLVPDGEEGISIYESSNGRGDDGELVLRFSSTIKFAPEVYSFNNHHMLAKAPAGRRNVTDSYVQIQAMFGERANDCAEGDTSCMEANSNSKDNNSKDSNTKDSGSSNDSTNTNERSQNG